MIISGLQKTTLLDYPEHIACTIFFGKCNLRCPFCHNMELVEHPEHFPNFSIDQILSFLKERVGKLNGVAITGGEPLLNKDIEDLLKPIKELGYPIKLDTNGFFPDMIEKLINEDLVDMFAMDIKAGWTNYLNVCGIESYEILAVNNIISDNNMDLKNNVDEKHCNIIDMNSMSNKWRNRIEKSIELIICKAKDYEFRTTCVKGLHTDKDFYEIKDMIRNAKKYFLQDYKAGPGMESLPYKPFTREELEYFASIVRSSVVNVEIRGIDWFVGGNIIMQIVIMNHLKVNNWKKLFFRFLKFRDTHNVIM